MKNRFIVSGCILQGTIHSWFQQYHRRISTITKNIAQVSFHFSSCLILVCLMVEVSLEYLIELSCLRIDPVVYFLSFMKQNYRKGIKICKPLKNKGSQKSVCMSYQHICELQHSGCYSHRHGAEMEKRRQFPVFRVYGAHPGQPIN